MWSFLVLFSCAFSAGSLTTVTAPVGGKVTIKCSHFLAHLNIKYFCRDPCAEGNVLIKSETGERETRRGRYTLHNMGTEFTVIIAGLRKSDSGTYICAVERLVKDTFQYVTLYVIEGSTQMPVPVSTSRQPARRTTRETTENKGTSVISKWTAASTPPVTSNRSAVSEHLFYIAAGLGTLVLILTVLLFIFIKQKYKQKRCSSTVTSSVHLSDSYNYATLNFTSQSDSLYYSSVVFIKEPDCNINNSEKVLGEETLYSSVRT